MASKKKKQEEKVDIDPFTGLPEDQLEAWLADDSGRRGYRSVRYWDIRQKSMTPPEAQKAVLEAAGVEPDEELVFIFRDFSTAGFFTKDQKLALEVIERGLDFLFDKKSGIWFIDLYGHHQIVMRALIALYTKQDYYDLEYKEAADQYIEEGYGFFESGAAGYGPPTVRMGENYSLPAELKTVFSRMGFRIWRL